MSAEREAGRLLIELKSLTGLSDSVLLDGSLIKASEERIAELKATA